MQGCGMLSWLLTWGVLRHVYVLHAKIYYGTSFFSCNVISLLSCLQSLPSTVVGVDGFSIVTIVTDQTRALRVISASR
jgi:hypothetical protein